MAAWVIGDRRRCIASLTSARLTDGLFRYPRSSVMTVCCNGSRDSGGGFHRLLFAHGAEDVVDYPVLDGEDIAIAHHPRRVR